MISFFATLDERALARRAPGRIVKVSPPSTLTPYRERIGARRPEQLFENGSVIRKRKRHDWRRRLPRRSSGSVPIGVAAGMMLPASVEDPWCATYVPSWR